MKILNQFILISLFIAGSLSTMAQCNSGFSYTLNPNDSAEFIFTDSVNSWSFNTWDFGDGTSYSGSSPVTHRFSKNGTYTVCHLVVDSTRTCVDSTCKTIVVNSTSNKCSASYTFTVRNDTVDFTNTSSSTATGYLWSMGDGSSSTAKSPTHVFSTNPGTPTVFTVCLTIYDSINRCQDQICQSITIYVRGNCQAYFTTYVNGDSAKFTNRSSSTGSGIYWTWDFGDSSYSNDQDPLHIYAQDGYYGVCLVMYDSNSRCSSTYCDSIRIDSSNTVACRASFTASVNGLNVSFNNTSTGANTYSWSFGDGTSSAAKFPGRTYSKPGTYTVCLAISGSASCADTFCLTVKVDTTNCKASFRVGIDTTQKFKLYLINSSSKDSANRYQWSFGDGSGSNLRNPTHQYSTFGRYLVCLTVSNSVHNCTQRFCDSLGLDSTGKLLKAGFLLEVVEDDFSTVVDLEELTVRLYPNPVHHMLKVDVNDKMPLADVQIVGLDGSEVLTFYRWETNNSIDVGMLESGLYLIWISDGKSVIRARFIKSE